MAMPKIEQRNLQVFFVPKDNDFDELERFITKNKAMLKLYLLIVEDLNPRLKELLDKYEIDYIKPKNQHFGKKSLIDKNISDLQKNLNLITKDSSKDSGANQANQSPNRVDLGANLMNQSVDLSDSNATNPTNLSQIQSQVFTELIRSGKEISGEGDIIVFNRVNSGANIKSSKNVFVFGKCDGNIDCRGDFMVLSKIAKGKILFKGLAITPNMLKYKLNLITKDHIGLKIDDILSL